MFVHGTDPGEPYTESDGYTDLAELLLGSDPLDPASFPGPFFVPTLSGPTALLVSALLAVLDWHWVRRARSPRGRLGSARAGPRSGSAHFLEVTARSVGPRGRRLETRRPNAGRRG